MLVQEGRNSAQCTKGCFTIYGDKETVLKEATTHSRKTGHKVNMVLGTDRDAITRMRHTSCPNCGKSWDLHLPNGECPESSEYETRACVEQFSKAVEQVPILNVKDIGQAADFMQELLDEKIKGMGRC